MKQYTATANDDGVRLSRFVQSVTRDFPTSLFVQEFPQQAGEGERQKGRSRSYVCRPGT